MADLTYSDTPLHNPAAGSLSLLRRAWSDRGLRLMAVLFLVTLPLLTPRVSASDEIEYFSYLHSLVFDHDLNFRNEYEYFCNLDPADCVRSRFAETFLDIRTPTGLQLNYGPLGSALLWAPFYVAAHPAALVLHAFLPQITADGLSAPYIYAISLASLFYGWLGLALSYKLARSYVRASLALGATLGILLSTNAVYYMYVAPAMSHAPSLFASALFVWIWYRTRAARARGEWRSWAVLGASGALMTLVREQEAILVVIPLVETLVRAGAHWRRGPGWGNALLRSGRDLAVMFAAWFLAFVPQFAVYRALNGNFLPARDVTGKFTWDGAHVGDVLFSSLHGLFSWTPITLLAIVGLLLLWRRDWLVALAFLLAFAAEVYLLGSFSTWFGGAGFGARRFMNCTVFFVVGLAILADVLQTRVPAPALAAGGALLALWNLFFIVQFATGMIPRAEAIDFERFAYDQVLTVPARLGNVIWRFLTARGSFYRQ